jgi:hypothetical protein
MGVGAVWLNNKNQCPLFQDLTPNRFQAGFFERSSASEHGIQLWDGDFASGFPAAGHFGL